MQRRQFMQAATGALLGSLGTGMLGIPRALYAQGGTGRREVFIAGRRIKTIDVHAHTIVPGTMELIGQTTPEATNLLLGVGPERIARMDELGIDVEVLSINPFWYGLGEADARRVVQFQNEQLAELCARYPDRLVGLATVALQHPQLAAQQLQQGLERYGFRGVSLGGSVAGEELATPRFDAFWERVQALDTPIFLHPQGVNTGLTRTAGNGYLSNVIGNPLDTTIALSHLIFEGVLDRFPRLKIVAAHGGGYLGSYPDRSDYGCRTAPAQCAGSIERRPTDYLRDMYFDSLVFSDDALRYLVTVYGADHIMLATDYPYPWTDRPVDHVLEADGLSDVEKVAILGGNAQRMFGIPA
jgi:aminocarboxymuconate-semialdehyde decarboxylase